MVQAASSRFPFVEVRILLSPAYVVFAVDQVALGKCFLQVAHLDLTLSALFQQYQCFYSSSC